MGIQEPRIDLHEMKVYFEQEIHKIHTLSDMELSENDFRRLGFRLKPLFTYDGRGYCADDWMLCAVVYWTYSFIYWDDKYDKTNQEFVQAFEKLSQYMRRHQLDLFLECFHDYGLNCYRIQTGNLLQDCKSIVARHAGIPYDEQTIVFELIRRYIDEDSGTILESVLPYLPKKTLHIVNCMDKQTKIELMEELKNLVLAVNELSIGREELIKEFPNISITLISNCLYWNESQLLKTCTM